MAQALVGGGAGDAELTRFLDGCAGMEQVDARPCIDGAAVPLVIGRGDETDENSLEICSSLRRTIRRACVERVAQLLAVRDNEATDASWCVSLPESDRAACQDGARRATEPLGII